MEPVATPPITPAPPVPVTPQPIVPPVQPVYIPPPAEPAVNASEKFSLGGFVKTVNWVEVGVFILFVAGTAMVISYVRAKQKKMDEVYADHESRISALEAIAKKR